MAKTFHINFSSLEQWWLRSQNMQVRGIFIKNELILNPSLFLYRCCKKVTVWNKKNALNKYLLYKRRFGGGVIQLIPESTFLVFNISVLNEHGVVALSLAWPPHSSRVEFRLILSSSYCLCRVSHFLHESVWDSFRFSGFFPPPNKYAWRLG